MTFFLYLACHWLGLTEHTVWQLSHSLLNMSITAAYVILVVIAVRFLLKKAPKKYSYLLWLVVAFRLACPFSLELDFSLMNVIDAPVSESGVVEYAPVGMIHDPYPEITLPATDVDELINTQLPAGLSQTIGDELETTNAVAVFLWTIGVDGMLLYALCSWWKLRAQLKSAKRRKGNVWVWDGARSPFILGIFRPKIYLPPELAKEELDYVLRHEQFHIRRGDHIVKLLAYALLTVHWFNPFVWLAFVLMGRDMEMSCDEQVLAQCGNIRKNYSTTLLSFAAGRRFPSPSPLAFGESSVKQRIKNVLKWKKPKVWVTALALALCLTAVVFCAANPVEDKTDLESPFGKTYTAMELLYDVPDDYHVTSLEMAPSFCLTGDYRLLTLEKDAAPEAWIPRGTGFVEIELKKAIFDDYFRDEDGWLGNLRAKQLRKENSKAWRLTIDKPELSYDLLQQKDGSLYAVCFYWDRVGDHDPASDDSVIRAVYRLEEAKNLSSAAVAAPMLMEDVPYVTQQCVYLSPLSSSIPGSDTGLTYTPRATHLEIANRLSGEVTQNINMEHDWQWQSLPYTEAEWEELWFATLEGSLYTPVDFNDYHGEKIWMPVSDDLFFLQDGENNALLLVDLFSGPKGEQFVWSIHTLVPEHSQQVAQWELPSPYQSAYRSVVEITPDLPYTRIVASCAYGELADYDGTGAAGSVIEFLPGSKLYWNPWKENGSLVMNERIDLSVEQETGLVHMGTLYLRGEKQSGGFDVTYTGYLSSATGLAVLWRAEGVMLQEMNLSVVQTPDVSGTVLPYGYDFSVLVGEQTLSMTTYNTGLPIDLTPFAVSESGSYLEAYLHYPLPEGGTGWDLMLRANTHGERYELLEIGIASPEYPLLSGVAVGQGSAEIEAAYGADAQREEGLENTNAHGMSSVRYRYADGKNCITFYLYEDEIYLIMMEALPSGN